jgi:hypothetical protein
MGFWKGAGSPPSAASARCSRSTAAVWGSRTTRRCWWVLVFFHKLTMLVEVDGTANGDHEVVKGQLEASGGRRSGRGGHWWLRQPRAHPRPVNWPGALDEPGWLFSDRHLGGEWWLVGMLGCVDRDPLHTSARRRAPLRIQWICRTVESESPRHTCGLQARGRSEPGCSAGAPRPSVVRGIQITVSAAVRASSHLMQIVSFGPSRDQAVTPSDTAFRMYGSNPSWRSFPPLSHCGFDQPAAGGGSPYGG